MSLSAADLYPGEQQILSKAANAIIQLDDYGLRRLPYDQLMVLAGYKGKEAIGGHLYLTNYRLIFKSHPVNRLRGQFSLFLPTITDVQNVSVLISRKIAVHTQTQRFEFVVWGIPALIAAIQQQSASCRQQLPTLYPLIEADPGKMGTGLNFSRSMDTLVMNLPEVINKVSGIATNPLDFSNLLNLVELVQLFTKGDPSA